VTLVVDGEAFVSQHVGDLEHFAAREAFERTIQDFLSLWRVRREDLVVVHDLHPQYVSSQMAAGIPAARMHPVQHHRAHIASVLAERGELERFVIGIAFDGTGYGDDGTIWGGEIFAGSVMDGLVRIAHLRPALLPGGDAAARHPVQSAAGFISQLDDLPALAGLNGAALGLPPLFDRARQLVRRRVRVFETTSAGRLFDAVAALLGFGRPVSYEGQAAIWLEQQARSSHEAALLPFSFDHEGIDYRPALEALVLARLGGSDPAALARAFHRGLAGVLGRTVVELAASHGTDTVVLSGGVFQNELLLSDRKDALTSTHLRIWTNRLVPPNDGGLSLGQAALALGAR
jgi:hydrogenase maturation protein HypF